jgi:hypothetical protein
MDVAGFFDGGWYLDQSFSKWAPGARVITTTPAADHSACCAVKTVVSILIPGPWVVEMVTDRM